MSAGLAMPFAAQSYRAVALRLAVLLLASGLALGKVSALAADALGAAIGSGLSLVAAPVRAALAPSDSDVALTETELAADFLPPARRAAATSNTPPRGPKHGHKPAPAHAIFISSAQVLALAARRALPAAAPVHATADHPAGLMLQGVSGLGVGLQDGDVLTEAAGQRASSVATVIGIVISARSRRTSAISGRFFRAGVPYVLTVEQPYPPADVKG